MATAKNDITGDLIKTKGSSSAYEENLGAIDWSVKRDDPKTPSDKPIEHVHDYTRYEGHGHNYEIWSCTCGEKIHK